MDLKELKRIVAKGESTHVEFKKTTTQRKPAAKTVCAMLNGCGGLVIFGISDKGEIKGQEVTSKTIEELTSEFRQISPPSFPEIDTVTIKGGLKAIVVNVPGKNGLFTFDGRPYWQNGPTTSVMPREEYEKRLIEKLHENHRWETEYAPKWFKISDLDEEEIQATLQNGLRLGRIKPQKFTDVKSILRGLKLLKNGKLLNAAIALYGKSDSFDPTFPQLSIRLARFRGINRLTEFKDNRQYKDHAFGLLRRAESFLLDHLPIAGRLVPGKMRREDFPLYPPLAFREAVANAICHRDYTTPGGAIAIAIYDDHLEVISPGTFHGGITPKKLMRPHESKPWNPLIANVFYCAGVIETWGSGTLNILDWNKENNNPKPKWQERTDCVVVTFFPRTPQPIQERIKSGLESRSESGLESETVSLEKKILKILQISPLSISEIAKKLGHKSISSGLRSVLKNLILNKVVEYTIPDKPQSRLQKYKMTNKNSIQKRSESGLESRSESGLESKTTSLEKKVLKILLISPLSASEIAKKLGHKSISSGLRSVLKNLILNKAVEYTIPNKPQSRLQKYKMTKKKPVS